jgi:hypothetical protein
VLLDDLPPQTEFGRHFPSNRVAIGVSALAAVVVGISAAVFAPNARGPGILFLAGLAILSSIYAVLAARVLVQRKQPEVPR